MDNVFLELAIMLSTACVIGYIAMRLRLPIVIAYLLAGTALSPWGISNTAILNTLPEIGIAFVLFLIGMELNLAEMKTLGRPIIAATLLQVTVSVIAGFGLATLFGFSGTEAVILGISLAFASTIVIVKLLSEKHDLSSLYGKLSVGILLFEDLLAILAMVAITENVFALGVGGAMLLPLGVFVLKSFALLAIAFLVSRYVLDPIFNSVARSIELLFLVAIAWCFLFTSLAVFAGFSVVIGAFLAGVALAPSPYQLQIQGKIKPIRDFFIALFFIYVGSQVDLADLGNALPAILVFAAFALLVKPFVYLIGLSFFNFRKHTLFQTSINLTQVSEFSVIVVLLAMEFGYATESALAVVAGAATLSMIISSILMNRSEALYERFKPFVGLLQKKQGVDVVPDPVLPKLEEHVIVIGADRVGSAVIEYLKSAGIDMLILDYNPSAVRRLRDAGYRAVYGDASDAEVLENLQIESARLIISTATGLVDNLVVLDTAQRKNAHAKIIVRTAEPENEEALRDAGADYVMLPERVSGDFLISKLREEWPNLHFDAERA